MLLSRPTVAEAWRFLATNPAATTAPAPAIDDLLAALPAPAWILIAAVVPALVVAGANFLPVATAETVWVVAGVVAPALKGAVSMGSAVAAALLSLATIHEAAMALMTAAAAAAAAVWSLVASRAAASLEAAFSLTDCFSQAGWLAWVGFAAATLESHHFQKRLSASWLSPVLRSVDPLERVPPR